ncbi:MAG: hypothetical protein KDE59_32190, partial [Anaerolineales bacterium]|nr:hypothetical protein [Anaerolineales bacterium]
LLTYRLLPKELPHFYAWFGVSWLLLALALEQATGGRRDDDNWRFPVTLLAHLLAPAGVLAALLAGADLGALLWPTNPYTVAASLTLALAATFYFRTYRRMPTTTPGLAGLYLSVSLCVGWLFLTPRTLWPGFAWVSQGLTLLASTIPLLWLARRLERTNPRAATVFYHLSSLVGLLALPILGANRWLQGAALYYLAGLAILATIWHRQPRWLYVAAIVSTLANGIILELLNELTFAAVAWSQLGWAALLILTGRFLKQRHLPRYETPLLATALAVLGLALLPTLIATSPTRQVGVAALALLLALIAYWQQGPLYLYAAVPIGFLAYLLGLEWFPTGWRYLHLYALPAALIAWRGARWLDNHVKPALGQKPPPYLWDNPVGWWAATGERLLSWWSLPFYLLTTAILLVSSFLTPVRWHGLIPLALSALVWGTFYRRTTLRIWLFAFAFWLQWLVYGLIKLWLPGSTVASQLLATGPVALLLLWVAARIGRRAPWGTAAFWHSPTLPLWILLGLDIILLQAFATANNYTGMALTVLNSILLGIWAFVWHRPVLTYGSLSLLAFALWQFC